MAGYLTVQKARQYAQRALNESTIIKEARDRNVITANCFLSHSSQDQEHLPGVIAFLEKKGAKVYIDKEDGELPLRTSRATADGLKNRIKQCRRMVILVSSNSKISRWVPWEIGLADGLKSWESIAVLPLTASDNESVKDWAGQEYLGLYNQILEDSLFSPSKGAQSLLGWFS